MGYEPILRRVAEEIAKAFGEFSRTHGWPESKYRLYLHFNEDWNTAHVIVVADKFGKGEIRDQARKVSEFLASHELKLLKHINSLNITLRTSAQIKEGGIYSIGPEFVALEE